MRQLQEGKSPLRCPSCPRLYDLVALWFQKFASPGLFSPNQLAFFVCLPILVIVCENMSTRVDITSCLRYEINLFNSGQHVNAISNLFVDGLTEASKLARFESQAEFMLGDPESLAVIKPTTWWPVRSSNYWALDVADIKCSFNICAAHAAAMIPVWYLIILPTEMSHIKSTYNLCGIKGVLVAQW